MLKRLLQISGFLILFALQSCSNGDSNQSTAPTNVNFNKFVFAIMYENAAWGDRQKGIYVDTSGDLYYYNNTAANIDFILDEEQFTETVLSNIFASSAVFISHTNDTLFSDYKNKVDSIKDGPYSALTNTCTDAGTFKYFAFDYNSSSQSYTPILIYHTGDFRMTNNHPDAEAIKNWLMNFGLQNDIVFELNPGEDNFCTGM